MALDVESVVDGKTFAPKSFNLAAADTTLFWKALI